MTLPHLLTVADIAKRVKRPTQWVRRRLKKMGVARKQENGRLYEVTATQLADLYAQLGRAVQDSELPEDCDEDCCSSCASLRAEVADLERQVVDLAQRLASANERQPASGSVRQRQ